MAALLINEGLYRGNLITTRVAPRALVDLAERAGITTTTVPVGFKNIAVVAERTARPVLGVEPNGAVVLATSADDYFERDSLRSLARMLLTFPTVKAFDSAVRRLRDVCPYPQRILNSPQPPQAVMPTVEKIVRPSRVWQDADVTGFADRSRRCVLVRRADTEKLTRVYVEVPPDDVEALRCALDAY